ncbi:uncharacterized protein LOC132754520 [Ruditapes philippinarum]|uniref:uncharacterized protein LOC132754520 n=1 Tax=Ruditapes philippinarum TaxID=129788 RepID=UPI00295B410B|nr:uncharacterized protein LOC132754520 [Ruditapes philippinarum]
MKSKSTFQRLKRTIAKGEKHTELLRSGAARTLERQRENMILQFDHFAEEINSTTSKIHADDRAKLQEKLNEADTVNDKLISMETDLCNMKKAQQRCKLFIKAKEAYHEVDKVEIKLENLKYGVSVNDYTYYPIENCRERPLGSLRMGKEQKFTNEFTALTVRVILELRMACQILKEFLSSWKYFLLFVILLLAVLGIKVNMVYILFLIITFVPLSMLRMNSWVDSYLSVGYDLAKSLLVICIKVTIWTYKILHLDNVKHWYLFCSLNEWYKQNPSTYISVKTKDNVTCNITGICFLSPIHLAAVDNYNSTVKLIDIEQEKVITELSVGKKKDSDRPWDVTKISSDQLAVTIPHSKTICFLHLTCCLG